MKKTSLIYKRYAKALLDISIKQNHLIKVYSNMSFFSDICSKEPLLKKLLRNPSLGATKKKEIIKKIFSEDLNEVTDKFITLLFNKGRAIHMCEIVSTFLALYDQYTNTKTAFLTIAYKIDDEIRNKIIFLALRLGNCKNIKLIEKIDPSIISGYILRVDSKQIDNSFKVALLAIKENLNNMIIN